MKTVIALDQGSLTEQVLLAHVRDAAGSGLDSIEMTVPLARQDLPVFGHTVSSRVVVELVHEGAAVAERVVEQLADGLVGAWRVDPHTRKDAMPGAAGTPTEGIRHVGFVRRRPGSTHEEFIKHWRDRHGPFAVMNVTGMTLYVQNYVVTPLSAGADELDGIANVHYESWDGFAHRFDHAPMGPESAERENAEDLARFVDTANWWHTFGTHIRFVSNAREESVPS